MAIADIYIKLHDFEQAKVIYRQAIDLKKQNLEIELDKNNNSLEGFVIASISSNSADSIMLAEELLKDRMAQHSISSPLIGDAYLHLAQAQQQQSPTDIELINENLQAALASYTDSLGESDKKVGDVYEVLGEITPDTNFSTYYFEKAIEIYEASTGIDSHFALRTKLKLANHLRYQSPHDSLAELQYVLARRESLYPQDDYNLVYTMLSIADIYRILGNGQLTLTWLSRIKNYPGIGAFPELNDRTIYMLVEYYLSVNAFPEAQLAFGESIDTLDVRQDFSRAFLEFLLQFRVASVEALESYSKGVEVSDNDHIRNQCQNDIKDLFQVLIQLKNKSSETLEAELAAGLSRLTNIEQPCELINPITSRRMIFHTVLSAYKATPPSQKFIDTLRKILAV